MNILPVWPSSLKVLIKRLPHAGGLPTPSKGTPGSAGFDLTAAVAETQTLGPGERALIPTGFVFAIPSRYEGQIRPRSGKAFNQGITVLNSPGTIDSDYRGEVKVLLVNLGEWRVFIERGDRIAQIVFSMVPDVSLEEISGLDETVRGVGGFGHTG